jgi:cardiolipin synthase
MPDWLTLPNLLTVARIAITPWIGVMIARGEYARAFPWYFLASMSDTVDGYLARRFRWTSAAGAYLDPIADKLMIVTLYLALAWAEAIPKWVAGVVLGRDLLILLMALMALAFTTVRKFPPSVWGKWSTFCQLSYGGFTFMYRAWPQLPLGLVIEVAKWAAVAATIWSGIHYAYRAYRTSTLSRDSAH